MRILYHHRTQAEDGQAVHIRALIEAFEARGDEVFEVGLVRRHDEGGPKAETPEGRGWSWVAHVPRFAREIMEYGYSGLARQKILSAAAHFRPDFIYERYAFGNAAGVMAARRMGKPLVLEVNSPMVEELERTRGLVFRGLARKVEGYVFGAADRVCVVTQVLGDMLVELGVKRERLLVTPNGVHLSAYDYGDREEVRARARRELGLVEEGRLALGFVGYYRKWHRLDAVLDALARPGLERAELVLIGEGPARAQLEAQAARLGISERVTFAGPRAHGEIPGLLPAFDVALIPAINPYASPLKLFEYMAAGLPVVAPDQPNLREIVSDGHDALLVQAGEVDELGEALRRLEEDASLRSELGRRARATVEARELTWQANARRVVESVGEIV